MFSIYGGFNFGLVNVIKIDVMFNGIDFQIVWWQIFGDLIIFKSSLSFRI